MQEGQDTQIQAPIHSSPSAETVGFPPQAREPKRSFSKLPLLVGLGLILIGGAAFFVLKGSDEEDLSPTPTPRVSGIEFINTPAPSVAPTATPASVDKTSLSVQILNGTGIPGEAGYLETQLKALGYTKTQTGNATGASVTVTTFLYGSGVAQSVIDEINTKLGGIYKQVESKSGSTGMDIKITVGLRKGATPRPETVSSTGTPKPSASASPIASASPKPTATP